MKKMTFKQYCQAIEFDFSELFIGQPNRESILSHFKIALLKEDQLVPYAFFTLAVFSG
jgi:hypothetical protein